MGKGNSTLDGYMYRYMVARMTRRMGRVNKEEKVWIYKVWKKGSKCFASPLSDD